ncbi:alpha/beta hydrolase [Streptomyces sp. Je 1-79]|uniref:alpha/beta fold hydrolase n=1 Tax=Streptomyces sp. Je 1-79 TaxID=2943847 RepID=UPI0021A4B59F|nr:alpha/beta hydrolase [Streptomyces sp. Je 1-79]MCT4354721.1 alpha/beta hydrolase [Streptomyces sp. Je 1-79]
MGRARYGGCWTRWWRRRRSWSGCWGTCPPAYAALQTLQSTLPPLVLRDDAEQVAAWRELLGGQASVWASPAGEAGQAAASWGWLRGSDRMAALAGIRVPALVLAFEHDLYFPPHTGRTAADALPDGRFTQVDSAAHGGPLTHPKETADAVLRFLAAQ